MSYSYVKHRISDNYPPIQIGVDNEAAFHKISNTTNDFRVNSDKSSSTQLMLFVGIIICIIIAVFIIKRQMKK